MYGKGRQGCRLNTCTVLARSYAKVLNPPSVWGHGCHYSQYHWTGPGLLDWTTGLTFDPQNGTNRPHLAL